MSDYVTLADVGRGDRITDLDQLAAASVETVERYGDSITVSGRYWSTLDGNDQPIGVGQPYTYTGAPSDRLLWKAEDNAGSTIPREPGAIRSVAKAVVAVNPKDARYMADVLDVADNWTTAPDVEREWAQDYADAEYRKLVDKVSHGSWRELHSGVVHPIDASALPAWGVPVSLFD